MTVKELIEALSALPGEWNVHTDEDDYPHVVGVQSSNNYTGAPEYKPAGDTVLLTIDFPDSD